MVSKHATSAKLFAAIIAGLMVFAMSSTTALAAAKKSVASYGINYEKHSATYADKKTTAVNKGTTNLTFRGKTGLIKFVAPKAGRYTFTFTNCANRNAQDSNCYFGVLKKSPNYNGLTYYTVKTTGGKYSTLHLSINNKNYSSQHKLLYRPLKTRAAKQVKLKKGEKIYFYKGNKEGSTKDMTCKLAITRS